MKKEFKIMSMFVMLISMLLLIPNVYAEEMFGVDFKTKETNQYIPEFYYTNEDFNIAPWSYDYPNANLSNVKPYKDGYIEVNVLIDSKHGTEINYYDYDGTIKKSKYIENYYIVSPIEQMNSMDFFLINNGDIYCYAMKDVINDMPTMNTIKLNENFEVVKEVKDVMPITIIDNKIYVAGTKAMYEYDLELTNRTVINDARKNDNSARAYLALDLGLYDGISPNKLSWLIEKIYKDIVEEKYNPNNPFLDYGYDYHIYDINDEYVMFLDEEKSYITILDRNGSVVCKRKVDRNEDQYIKLVHDYISIIKNKANSTPSIDIYDFDGNKIQTINKPEVSMEDYELFVDIIETDIGFAAMSYKDKGANGMDVYTTSRYPDDPNFNRVNMDFIGSYYNEFYSMAQPITLSIMGNGNVRVFASARFGQRVTFEVETPEGQMLKSVKVFDSYKNSIEVENNSFIMPRTPVTINAEFVPVLKENPKTGLTTFTGFAILAVSLTIYFKKNKNKLTTLKKI